jgi:hypothetical protein
MMVVKKAKQSGADRGTECDHKFKPKLIASGAFELRRPVHFVT